MLPRIYMEPSSASFRPAAHAEQAQGLMQSKVPTPLIRIQRLPGVVLTDEGMSIPSQ